MCLLLVLVSGCGSSYQYYNDCQRKSNIIVPITIYRFVLNVLHLAEAEVPCETN